MAGNACKFQLRTMVVGSSSDEFVRRVVRLLVDKGIENVFCEDVYCAVGVLASGGAGGGVVIGRLGELSMEDGRFFEISRRHGFGCCCYVDKDLAERRRQILRAMQSGAYIVGDLEEVPDVLAELSAVVGESSGNGQARSSQGMTEELMDKLLGSVGAGASGSGRAAGFLKDEFRTTKAELDALLGVEVDDS